MQDGIYTKEELFENENNFSLSAAYNIIKNIDNDKDYYEQLKDIALLRNVYDINCTQNGINTKEHIGWLISPYHYISCDNPEQLYFSYGMLFFKDDDDDIILDKEWRFMNKIFNTTFNVYIYDARSHDLVEFRTEHWLHKAGLDGFPLHISMSCDCGFSECRYNNEEFYYDESESFNLQKLEDDIPLVKVNVMVEIRNNLL